jgi:uncharacterized membrane protein YfcA
MSVFATAFLLLAAFLTATLSGVFGMAGGLVLMGCLALVLPVSAAMVTHGLLQLVANAWRVVLHRRHVAWRIVAPYAVGAVAAAAMVALLSFVPSRRVLYTLLGLVPLLVWLPVNWVALDASRPRHALAAGFAVTAVNLLAGVAGPLLDIFFVRTALTRHRIVATKSATQVFSHAAKVVVYGGPMLAVGTGDLPSLGFFALSIPLSMAGTVVGGRILDRMDDANFRRWTRWVLTVVGAVYLVQAIGLWRSGG